MKLKNLISVSLPTKAQVVRGVEVTVLVYVVMFFTTLALQPDPLNKSSILAAAAAALTAVYALVKGFLTDL